MCSNSTFGGIIRDAASMNTMRAIQKMRGGGGCTVSSLTTSRMEFHVYVGFFEMVYVFYVGYF